MSFDAPAARRGPRQTGPTGSYRLDLATQRWWWSDGIYAMHGFHPGEVVPTTELVLAHQHPEDRRHVAELLAAARPTDQPFGRLHRVVDATGCERTVVVVGRVEDVATEPGGGPTVLGYATDVSKPLGEDASTVANRQIQESSRSRGTIERAKGALAAIYRIDPDAAFEVMRAASNDQNVPLREIAEAVIGLAIETTGRRARLEAYLGGAARPPAEPRPLGASSVPSG